MFLKIPKVIGLSQNPGLTEPQPRQFLGTLSHVPSTVPAAPFSVLCEALEFKGI